MESSNLSKAASLAKWLIQVKKKPPTVAYIIAVNKFKLPPMTGRELVRKEYQKIKNINPNQISLI